MISREEVAKKLREAAEDIEEVSPYPAIVLNEITNIIAINEITSYQDFFNRLADLIDHPTCEYLPRAHAIWYDDDGEEHEDTKLEALGTSEDTYCSVCGYEMVAGDDGWFDYERKEHGSRLIPLFDYCPNCGSKVVVSEDE